MGAEYNSPEESLTPGETPAPSPTPLPTATPVPTPPPISVQPASGQIAVGASQTFTVQGSVGAITVTSRDPKVATTSVDQDARTFVVTGVAPGTPFVDVVDSRGISFALALRIAYSAGVVTPNLVVSVTGDPASQDFLRDQVLSAILRHTQIRPGAQIVVSGSDIPFNGRLDQDNDVDLNVPVLIQGNNYFDVNGTTRVHVENVAAPRISPDTLMVSDYPERLDQNGVLFAAELHRDVPSRFLYFHYNPSTQPDRRIVLRAVNDSPEPTIIQFIAGHGGPTPNEKEVGHEATQRFLQHVVQNEGRLITIDGNQSINVLEQDLPAGTILCSLLQLRVLSGGDVHLTLFAQNATDDPQAAIAQSDLLQSTVVHARGVYDIPEFHYATQWDVTSPYLELQVGQIPLPNSVKGVSLAGDYGVLQSFVVSVENPLSTPQRIAIYENPRGGSATGTYLIDGVLVQSHQAAAFSQYKLRQYVVPAKGFVRVTIVTMPEGGSSYPLKLIFAPDDGSVAPGAPGSPTY